MNKAAVTLLVTTISLLGMAGCAPKNVIEKYQPAVSQPSAKPKNPSNSAANIAEKLQSNHVDIVGVYPVTSANDPDGLLGKPGEYTAKAYFAAGSITDARTQKETKNHNTLQYGGAVEVFKNNSDAKHRYEQLLRTKKRTESDFVQANVVLRVTNDLPSLTIPYYQWALQDAVKS